MARTRSRVEPMQEMCGAAGRPAARISSTVSKVRSCVEPPAPKVTEKKAGFSSASFAHTMRSFSTPSGVCGGKNSTESSGLFMLCPQEEFTVAIAAGDGALEPISHCQSRCRTCRAQLRFDLRIDGRIADYAALADCFG